MLLFPLPLARNKENENIESRILIDCAPHTMILVYTLPAALKGKDCCRRGRILCPRYELTRIKNSFFENIHSLSNLSYPICHY